MRRAIPLVLLAALAGCDGSYGEPAGTVASWTAPEPYLPPPTTAAPATAAADDRRAQDAPIAATTAGQADRADEATTASGAPSDAQIARELEEAFGKGNSVDRATLNPQGLAQAPPTAPRKLVAMINAANQVARKPYVYGGGHGGGGGPEGLFQDTAYDCSGSMSYAMAAAGLIESPMASGPMMSYGKPGPGKWVTIYANEGHAFMVVAGLRFDTSGRAERDTRWQTKARSVAGFTVRHPPGL